MTIKGSLQMSITIIKAFLRLNFDRQKVAKNVHFWREMWSI